MAKKLAKAKRVGAYKHLEPISKSTWNRSIRNRRCVIIGGDEGGSTYQCGKQVLVSDHVNDLYYRMRGKNAMYVGYSLKQRNAGYTPKRKSSYKGRR